MTSLTAERQSAFASRVLAECVAPETGPMLVVACAVHGNETGGVIAAQRVFDTLSSGGYLKCGSCVALIGNRTALGQKASIPARGSRYVDEDLNRLFEQEIFDECVAANPESLNIERRELLEFSEAFDDTCKRAGGRVHVVDLHSFSSPGTPFVLFEDSLLTRDFALHLHLPLVLGLEEELRGLLIDYTTNERGCVSVAVEGGVHDDPRSIEVFESAIWLSLEAAGMLTDKAHTHVDRSNDYLRTVAGARANHIFEIRHRRVIEDLPFDIVQSYNVLSPVRQQSVVAFEAGAPVRAELEGMLFMPNRQHDARVGDDGFFVVHRVGHAWLTVSSALRRWKLAHAILPFLPGVRCDREDRSTLRVTGYIARFLKREIFHLLGYRLVSYTDSAHSLTPEVGAQRRTREWVVSRHPLDLDHHARGGHPGIPDARRKNNSNSGP